MVNGKVWMANMTVKVRIINVTAGMGNMLMAIDIMLMVNRKKSMWLEIGQYRCHMQV